MEKKYELIKSDTTTIGETTLYRIKALKDFGDVKEGDYGGYIFNESNLSHSGNCWVYDFGKVHDLARVSGNGKVKGNAQMHDFSQVYGNGVIDGNCCLYDHSQVYGEGEVRGLARLYDNTQVYDNGKVKGKAEIHGNIQIYQDAILEGTKLDHIIHPCYEARLDDEPK